jgi:hypothetical protein
MVRESFLVILVGAGLAGCLGPVPVSLSVASAPEPGQGLRVGVMVSDDRSEKSAERVGIAREYNRDLVLVGNASLASTLEDELITALRARGYRARHARDNPLSDVSLLVRIVRFATDVGGLGPMRFEGRAVLVARATTGRTSDSVWTDLIDTREEIVDPHLAIPEAETLVARFFHKAAADLADRVSVELPPAGRGS